MAMQPLLALFAASSGSFLLLLALQHAEPTQIIPAKVRSGSQQTTFRSNYALGDRWDSDGTGWEVPELGAQFFFSISR
jgi:hypothetical protein